jgi:hypothetical protein
MVVKMESYQKNVSGFKNSCEKYRIIQGIRYTQWSYDTVQFDNLKAEAKKQGLKTRIIAGELFIKVKSC